jgi:hypothetical protein
LLTERSLSLDRMPRQPSAREDRGRPIEATEGLKHRSESSVRCRARKLLNLMISVR